MLRIRALRLVPQSLKMASNIQESQCKQALMTISDNNGELVATGDPSDQVRFASSLLSREHFREHFRNRKFAFSQAYFAGGILVASTFMFRMFRK